MRNFEGPKVFKPCSDYKTIHYISDGSGRDKYILINSGGLMNSGTELKFKNSLRAD